MRRKPGYGPAQLQDDCIFGRARTQSTGTCNIQLKQLTYFLAGLHGDGNALAGSENATSVLVDGECGIDERAVVPK